MSDSQPIFSFKSFVYGLVIGLIIGVTFGYLGFNLAENFNVKNLSAYYRSQLPPPKINLTASLTNAVKPKYEFFEILTDSNIENSKDTNSILEKEEIVVKQQESLKKHDKNNKMYTLQIGSFRSKQEAVSMIEDLKKNHIQFEFDLSTVPVQGIMWYRVVTKPFYSKEDVLEAKKILGSYNINDTLIRTEHN